MLMSRPVMKKLKNYAVAVAAVICVIVGNIPRRAWAINTYCCTSGATPSIISALKMGGYKIHINHILVMVDYWANDAIRYGFSKLAVGE
jgi:hypothetical protein